MAKLERRALAIDAEFRVEGGEDKAFKIVGRAAVYNQLSEDLGGFRERIAPGAFSGAMSDDVRALVNHDPSKIIGRTTAGTLALRDESDGLHVEIDPPDTTDGRDVMVSIKRGDISGMSFAFRTREDSWGEVDGETIRTLLDVELLDVSPVSYPAYRKTDVNVALRSLETFRASVAPATPFHLMEAEMMLAEAGES